MRYAAGTKDVLERFFNNKPLKKDDVIVEVSHSKAQLSPNAVFLPVYLRYPRPFVHALSML